MSAPHSTDAVAAQCGASSALLYDTLCRIANRRTGEARASLAELVEATERHKATVARALGSLEAAGFVETVERRGKDGESLPSVRRIIGWVAPPEPHRATPPVARNAQTIGVVIKRRIVGEVPGQIPKWRLACQHEVLAASEVSRHRQVAGSLRVCPTCTAERRAALNQALAGRIERAMVAGKARRERREAAERQGAAAE